MLHCRFASLLRWATHTVTHFCGDTHSAPLLWRHTLCPTSVAKHTVPHFCGDTHSAPLLWRHTLCPTSVATHSAPLLWRHTLPHFCGDTHSAPLLWSVQHNYLLPHLKQDCLSSCLLPVVGISVFWFSVTCIDFQCGSSTNAGRIFVIFDTAELYESWPGTLQCQVSNVRTVYMNLELRFTGRGCCTSY